MDELKKCSMQMCKFHYSTHDDYEPKQEHTKKNWESESNFHLYFRAKYTKKNYMYNVLKQTWPIAKLYVEAKQQQSKNNIKRDMRKWNSQPNILDMTTTTKAKNFLPWRNWKNESTDNIMSVPLFFLCLCMQFRQFFLAFFLYRFHSFFSAHLIHTILHYNSIMSTAAYVLIYSFFLVIPMSMPWCLSQRS